MKVRYREGNQTNEIECDKMKLSEDGYFYIFHDGMVIEEIEWPYMLEIEEVET